MTTTTPRIAVTGATGKIGGRVAARLAALNVPQRLVVRDRSRAPRLPAGEIVTATDYADQDAMQRALEGIETLFLVSGTQAVARVRQHQVAVDAALASGVRRIVYLSFLAAAAEATFTFARDHFLTEQHIRDTGVDFTFLRPSLYLDTVPRWVGADGALRGPAGNGRIARVSRDDVADVAAAVLTTDGHDGRTYDLTGPEALTMAETAAILTRVVGRPISYQEESLEEARASRRPSGAPDWEIEGWVTSYAAIATGEMDVVDDAVPRLTGHPAQSLESYLRSHPESYQPLLAASR